MKKTLSSEEVEKLAKLSNLVLTDSEKKKIASQFGETLEFVENLKDLDTSKISSITNVTGQENKFFEDGVENRRLLTQDEALGNVKTKKDGLFVVPKIFK